MRYEPGVDSAGRYDGDITLVLEDGLNITIENDLLVLPAQQVDDSGAIVPNKSLSEVLIQPLPDPDTLPLLGRQFFSKAYMYVNYDSAEYTLWEATATEETNLVAGGEKCSASPVSMGTGDKDSISGSGLSTGEIAGAVVGSIFGAALIALVAIVTFKRHIRESQNSHQKSLAQGFSSESQDIKSWSPTDSPAQLEAATPLAEMDPRPKSPQELGGKPKLPQELG